LGKSGICRPLKPRRGPSYSLSKIKCIGDGGEDLISKKARGKLQYSRGQKTTWEEVLYFRQENVVKT